MTSPERFTVALAAAGTALVLGLGTWLPRPASFAMAPTGLAPAGAAGGALVAALDQVTLAIDGMT